MCVCFFLSSWVLMVYMKRCVVRSQYWDNYEILKLQAFYRSLGTTASILLEFINRKTNSFSGARFLNVTVVFVEYAYQNSHEYLRTRAFK